MRTAAFVVALTISPKASNKLATVPTSGRAGRLLLQGVAPRLIEAAEVPVLVVGEQAT